MTMTSTNDRTVTVDVTALRAELAADPDTLLVDVRTPGEYRSASIDGSVNLPLDQLELHRDRIATRRRMVLICQSGARAVRAAAALSEQANTAVLDGGMNAWVAAGAPVAQAAKPRWALERQVRLVAGGIVASSILGSIWAPRLRFLAGGIGAGLTFAAVSNTCAMGNMLMKLPYNRSPEADVERAIGRLRG